MRIKVKFFASLREKAQKNEENITEVFLNASDLYQSLKEKYQFSLNADDIKVAINGEYQNFTTPLVDGDVVTFIPPVAGG
jgi:molybdopterin synthase sulfur carrier subunit